MTKRKRQSKPLRLVHASAPEGCLTETMSAVRTRPGSVTVRVRRFGVLDHVGGHVHPVPGVRIEVAVNAPATDGFRVVNAHYFDGQWRQPADDLAVHIEYGVRIERTVRDRQPAADRAPARPRRVLRPEMPSAPGMEEPGDGGPAHPSPPVGPSTAPQRVEVRRPAKRAA